MQQIGGGSAEKASTIIYQSEHLLFFSHALNQRGLNFCLQKQKIEILSPITHPRVISKPIFFLSLTPQKRNVKQDVHVAFFHMITVNSDQASKMTKKHHESIKTIVHILK